MKTGPPKAIRASAPTVLCPVDISDLGDAAVPVAYRLAGPHATVHLLHVCEPPSISNPFYTHFVPGPAPTHDEIRAGEERVRRRLCDLCPPEAAERNIQTRCHVLHGVNVASAIDDAARRLNVDLIVMATHGRGGLKRVVLGSVAQRVVHLNDFCVVLVRPATCSAGATSRDLSAAD